MFRLKQKLQQHSRQLLVVTNSFNPVNLSMQPFAQRNFSLFSKNKTPSAQKNQEQVIQETITRRTHEEIQKSIDQYKLNIEKKTQAGYSLSKAISETVEENKFLKMQRYEIFIGKMIQLYKSELRFRQKQKKKLQFQKNAPLYSPTPLKDILRAYNEMTVRGFNSELTTQTLHNVSSALRARGYKARVMNDYSLHDLYQSWRLQKVVDDIQFGLRGDQFFSPVHMADTAVSLADIGYKNSDLIPQFFSKLNSLLEERFTGKKEDQVLEFEHAVYGGPKNFLPRHYIFKGFENSHEFNEYLSILLDWQQNKKDFSVQVDRSEKNLENEVRELQAAMNQVINASVQVKELQKDYQASIENIRTQYFRMQEAADKNAFLQENEYIKYDLLELQELLVKGGYLNLSEVTGQKVLSEEPFENKMDRAAQVFYDYVLNYAPELLSPQHESFYEAAVKSMESQQQKKSKSKKYLQEDHNQIDLATLSRTLVGLSNQALSFNVDVVRKDYLNKFYEDYTNPQTIQPEGRKELDEIVMMERSYLRAWKVFTEESQKLLPKFKKLVKEDKNRVEGQLQALNALASCKFDEPELRDKIVKTCFETLRKSPNFNLSPKATLGGLMGLAQSATVTQEGQELAKLLEAKLNPSVYQFTEQVDALWALCALQQYQGRAIPELLKIFNQMNFERLDHDLKYEEYLKLLDIHNALKLEAPEHLRIQNYGLLMGLNGSSIYLRARFPQHSSKYDPFKERLVQALANGLTHASISHQLAAENELYQEQALEQDFVNSHKYPYKPDVLMGYKGSKVGVFILPESQAMRDTHKADGTQNFRMRLLAKANNNNLQLATISVAQVVNYDIEAFKVALNTNFNFQKAIESQIKLSNVKQADFSDLVDFGHSFIKKASAFTVSLPQQRDVVMMDAFVKKIYQVFHIKQQNDLRFEAEKKQAGNDLLRFELMKLSLMHDNLSKQCKDFISNFIPAAYDSFQSLLQKTANTIKQEDIPQHKISDNLDASWIGTRLEVELPPKEAEGQRKSIVPEIINQKFMWVEDYFHYQDWKQKQQEVFDNFNLLVIPPHKDAPKYFFDKDRHHRRIPQGIFPLPNFKRNLMQSPANVYAMDALRETKAQNDDLVLFEKEPFKMMVLNELKKSETLKPIDNEVSFITNLQNIKQGLKSNYSDKEILNTILLNLNFTEQLIEEHLNLKQDKKQTETPQYLSRNPKNFRDFVKSTYYSKDREDPYTHFYLKEALPYEKMKKMQEEEKKNVIIEDNTPDYRVLEQGQKRRENLQEKIDAILLDIEVKNEDLLDVSTSLKSNIRVKYDIKSLIKSEFVYDMDPELEDEGLSDQDYLHLFRRRSEAKLIKMKIIYKLYNNAKELTQNERTYLKRWMADIKDNKDRNLLNLRDSLVPSSPTKLAMKDVEAKSFYALNSISRVTLDRDLHGNFSLSDLVVELSHFLDEEVVNKVETEVFSDRLRKEWGLSKEFKAVETRNKEISLVLNELEELAWRASGMITEQDLTYLKRMLSVKRNKDAFDKYFYENDLKSLDHFVNEVNTYDNRIQLLEKWIVRKEDEIKKRVSVPTADLQKPDHEIFEQMEKPLRKARQRLVAKMVSQDEHGNAIDKQYKDLTSRELNNLVENLSIRLYLFNYEYPAFLPQVVKGIIEHPNLLRSDKEHLEAYCKIFELDWKGDQTYKGLNDFMFNTPIHVSGDNIKSYGEVTNEVVEDKLRKACIPYVEEAAQRLLNFNA